MKVGGGGSALWEMRSGLVSYITAQQHKFMFFDCKRAFDLFDLCDGTRNKPGLG